mgnify:CR=1 FL=1
MSQAMIQDWTESQVLLKNEGAVLPLSQGFNQMADSLTRAITGLDREKSLLATVVDALDDYLYTEDRAGQGPGETRLSAQAASAGVTASSAAATSAPR